MIWRYKQSLQLWTLTCKTVKHNIPLTFPSSSLGSSFQRQVSSRLSSQMSTSGKGSKFIFYPKMENECKFTIIFLKLTTLTARADWAELLWWWLALDVSLRWRAAMQSAILHLPFSCISIKYLSSSSILSWLHRGWVFGSSLFFSNCISCISSIANYQNLCKPPQGRMPAARQSC